MRAIGRALAGLVVASSLTPACGARSALVERGSGGSSSASSGAASGGPSGSSTSVSSAASSSGSTLCQDLGQKLHDLILLRSECDTCVVGANGDDGGCHDQVFIVDECGCLRALNGNMGAAVNDAYDAAAAFEQAGCPRGCGAACATGTDFHCGKEKAPGNCGSWCTNQ